MRKFLRRLKGILVTSLTSGVVGTLFGSCYGLVMMLLKPLDYTWVNVGVGGMLFGVFGLLAGGGFASFLAISSRGRTLHGLSRVRVAFLGALAGMLIGSLLYVGGVPDFMTLSEVLFPLLLGGGLGAGISTGIVETARRSLGAENALPGEANVDRIPGPAGNIGKSRVPG